MLLNPCTLHPHLNLQQTRQGVSHNAPQPSCLLSGQMPDRFRTDAGHNHLPPVCLPACVCSCSAGRLQAKFVIHTVGPVYENAEVSAPLLRKAYV